MLIYICILYSSIVLVSGICLYGLKGLIYFTYWVGLIQNLTFIHLAYSKSLTKLSKYLLLTSWSLGWTVTLMFWLYIYPKLSESDLPPLPQYLSSHGGTVSLISYYFLKSPISLSYSDIFLPNFCCIFYFFFLVLPLKQFGIIIYPGFMEELVPTLIYLLGALSLASLFFLLGMWLKKLAKNKTI